MATKDVLIVAEGDSWFNYGFESDIPSYLAKMDRRYHMIHKAWPGDDFIKYIQRRDYLDTLKSWQGNGIIKHRFLILSGGGNDMMKDHFEEYLNRGATTPDTYLSEAFKKKLKQILVTYDLVFHLLKTQLPEVKVIVHGYDYPIPRKKGPWLGNKMELMGIDHQQHGPAIMKMILDKFNRKLSKLAASYHNVEYINLLGKAGPDTANWDNEIHPEGHVFKEMASLFNTEIQNTIEKREGSAG